MSRYRVEAEFTPISRNEGYSAESLMILQRQLSVHSGDAFGRPHGCWRVNLFLSMEVDSGTAAYTAGDIFRAANKEAGMPDAALTEIHVHRVGGWTEKES